MEINVKFSYPGRWSDHRSEWAEFRGGDPRRGSGNIEDEQKDDTPDSRCGKSATLLHHEPAYRRTDD